MQKQNNSNYRRDLREKERCHFCTTQATAVIKEQKAVALPVQNAALLANHWLHSGRI